MIIFYTREDRTQWKPTRCRSLYSACKKAVERQVFQRARVSVGAKIKGEIKVLCTISPQGNKSYTDAFYFDTIDR